MRNSLTRWNRIMIYEIIPVFTLGLCWGSFLNVVAYRLVTAQDFVFDRSRCPTCQHKLAWYDLMPLVSWCILAGKCRSCKHSISIVYPLVELLTAVVLTALWYYIPQQYFLAYFIFISALLITVSSDLHTMLISRFVTLFLVPAGIIASYFNFLPITVFDSIAGAFMGPFFLWSIARFFTLIRNKEGIGQGDIDLLAFIGAFLGVIGSWFALCIAACTGALVGMLYIAISRLNVSTARIPFGPFLAMGAIIVVFFYNDLMYYFIC